MTGRAPARARPLDAATVALLALPVLLLALVALLVPLSPWGDQAVIQLSTDRAGALHQLLGPYSRFGWNHPGPLYFYLLALPYKVLGGAARDLAVGSVLLAGAAAMATVAAAGALAGRSAARWAGALSLVQLAALGPAVVAEVWNPIVIIVPTGTFLVCCAALAAGRWWGLPATVGTGSFLVQTDVGTAVLVVGSLGVALIVAVALARSRSRTPVGAGYRRRRPRRALGGSVLLGLGLWSAPLYQQLTRHPGNLTLIYRFFSPAVSGGTAASVLRHQTWRVAVEAIAGALWPPLRGRIGAGLPGLHTALVVLTVFGLVGILALLQGARSGHPEAAWLAGAALTGVVLAVVSAERVTGPLFSYLIDWSSSLALVLLLGAVLSRPALAPAGVVGLLAAGALVVATLVEPPSNSPAGRQVDALWSHVRAALPAGAPVRLHLASADRWPWQAGLMVDLSHHGHRVTVDSSWVFLFGPQFAPGPDTGADSGAPGGGAGAGPPEMLTLWRPGEGPPPAGRLVASVPGVRVFLSGGP